jgi:hypothetical protein
MTTGCAECARLRKLVDEVLDVLIELMRQQRDAFLDNNHTQFMNLDKTLELEIGHKERSIGALRQHRQQRHGDQL